MIQITTTSPFVDFAAEGIAAMLMAVIVNAAAKDGQVKPVVAIAATFVTTFVSGVLGHLVKPFPCFTTKDCPKQRAFGDVPKRLVM